MGSLLRSLKQEHMYLFVSTRMCLVAQSYLTLYDPVNYSPPGSSVRGILQTRILAWVAISFSREFPWPRNQTHVSCISSLAGEFCTTETCRKSSSLECCCSVTKSCLTLFNQWIAGCQAFLSLTVSQSLLRFMSIETVRLSNHLILCHPLLLLPSIFPSIRVFSSELALCIRWPKYWRSSISPSTECSGLISFRMDWLDLLAVQETLKSRL